jgi:hypothetical protein
MQISASGIGRFVLIAALAVWTISLAAGPMDGALDSFLHMINLPFHEAGHIIFSPFGNFMMMLGGSLMQVLVPLVCAAGLWFQTGDPSGALLCVWWAGENLVDLAPYINDARALKLMLLGGPAAEVEGHDWEAILTSLGWLHLDHRLAQSARLLGVVMMIAALIAAAVVTARQEVGSQT